MRDSIGQSIKMSFLSKILTSRIVWITVVGIVILNIVASWTTSQFDFTEDKKYSIAEETKALLTDIDQPIYAEILFAGDFEASPARLQNATEELLESFQRINPKIRHAYNDPYEGDAEQVQQNREELTNVGLFETSFTLPDGEEVRQKPAYPYVIFSKGEYSIPVNIIKEQQMGVDPEITINQSIALLEYKFATAIKRLEKGRKPLVYFTAGHDELLPMELGEYISSSRQFFQIGQIFLDSTDVVDDRIDVLVVAKPLKPFSDADLFKIDQYVMNGGKVIWMVDQLGVQLDSLRNNVSSFVPRDLNLGLDPLFFKYGFKLNKTLVVDTECTPIPMNVASQGGQPKIELIPYFYHLRPDPQQGHIIGSKLDRVNLLYASSIDTLKTKSPLKRTVLLKSSETSFEQQYPMTLDFSIQQFQTEFEKFQNGNKTIAMLMEGSFASLYANRPPPIDIDTKLPSISKPTAMVVIADGDLIKNTMIQGRNGQPEPVPIGFNRYDRYGYDNRAFFDNTLSYLLGEGDILQARKRDVQLRLLNQAKIDQEKTFWQAMNVGLPIVLLMLFAVVNGYLRKRKYT